MLRSTVFLLCGLLLCFTFFLFNKETKSDNVIPVNTVDSVAQNKSSTLQEVTLQRSTRTFTAEPKYIKKDKDGVEYLDYEEMYRTAVAMDDPERAATLFPAIYKKKRKSGEYIWYLITPPEKFTGLWLDWNEKGKVSRFVNMINGKGTGVLWERKNTQLTHSVMEQQPTC